MSARQNVVIILIAFFCVVFMTTGISAAPIIVKWGDSTPKSFSYWAAMQAFKSEVERKTGGKVEFQLFGDGVLGDQKTLTESTVMGSIQMSCMPTLMTQNIVPEHQALSLPFIWPSAKAFSDFLISSEGKRLGDLFEKHELKLVAWSYMGNAGVQNSKREIRTPADLKGLKIRVLPNPVMVDTFNALGGMAVAMGTAEVYSALQQGVIDGIATSPQFLNSMKIFELAKYYTDLTIQRAAGVTIINLKFWNSLSPDIQKAFVEASETWNKIQEAYYTDSSKETSDERIMDLYRKLGVKITEPDFEAFRKATIPVVRKYREKIGPELVDRVLKFAGYKFE
jgi:tripartite ATP-independent transporter DctP family solute receptor